MTARLRLVLLSASILAVGAACGSNAASNGATLSVAATAKAADATSSPTTLDLTAAKKAAEKAISGGGGGGGGDDGGGPPGGGDGGGFGPGFGPGGNLDAAATAIGITTADLSTAMAAGQTIAQVAQTRGVNIDVVVDAMVAPIKQHFDDEVGIDHTRADADRRIADARAQIVAMVNGQTPVGGPGGAGGDDGNGPNRSFPPRPSSSTPSSTTA